MFDDMKADMEPDKKLSPIVTELFLRGTNSIFHISIFNFIFHFISQSYFKVPKTIRLNGTHYFIINIPNKRELQ